MGGCNGTIASCASTSVAAILIPVLQYVVCVRVLWYIWDVHVSCDADLSAISHMK